MAEFAEYLHRKITHFFLSKVKILKKPISELRTIMQNALEPKYN